eukprot:GEMP01047707.1.p1 GENE.GEMP01047707.1~~GEMP01047707.1.p1  ORF type:complete len:296 (+),score=65.95 GEMP01047707.1:121-1008(+)
MRVVTLIVFFARAASGGSSEPDGGTPSWSVLASFMVKEEMRMQQDKLVALVKRVMVHYDGSPILNVYKTVGYFTEKFGKKNMIKALENLHEVGFTVRQYDPEQYIKYVPLPTRYFVTSALLTVVLEKIREVEKELSTKLQKLVKPYKLLQKMKREKKKEMKQDVKFNIMHFQKEFVEKYVRNPIRYELQTKTGVADFDTKLVNMNSLADEIQKELNKLMDQHMPCDYRNKLQGHGRVLSECVAPDQSPGWSTAAILALAFFCFAALFAIAAICWVARQQPNGETEADEGMDDAGF